MLRIAIILFSFAACLGLTIAIPILKNEYPRKIMVFLHGIVAISAIIALFIAIILEHMHPLLIVSVVLFIFTASFGICIFKINIVQKDDLFKLLVIFHLLLAMVSFIVLITYLIAAHKFGATGY